MEAAEPSIINEPTVTLTASTLLLLIKSIYFILKTSQHKIGFKLLSMKNIYIL